MATSFRNLAQIFTWTLHLFFMINKNFAYGVTGATLSVWVEEKAKQCFYQEVLKPVKYRVDWRVVRGGRNDIDVKIEKPNGELELDMKKSNHGSHAFETVAGIYNVCFSNEFSTVTDKQVFFSFRPENIESLAQEAGEKGIPKAETALEMSFENMHGHLTNVLTTQLDYRNKASLSHNEAEHLNLCVQLMSVILAGVIFVIGLGQVFIVRTFFSDTHGIIKGATITQYTDPTGL